MGLINNDDYCHIMDANLTKNSLSFITDYNPDGLARQIMNEIGHDALPLEVNKDMPKDLFN